MRATSPQETANAVVWTPPVVEPGLPPMNMRAPRNRAYGALLSAMSEMLNPAVRAVALNRLSHKIQYHGSADVNRLPSIILIRNRISPPPSTRAAVMRTTQPSATLARRTISRYMANPRLPQSTMTIMIIWPPIL